MFSAFLQGNFGETGPAGRQVSVRRDSSGEEETREVGMWGRPCARMWPSIAPAGDGPHTWLLFLITQGPPGPVGATGIKGEKVSLGTFPTCSQGELPQRTLALIPAFQGSPLPEDSLLLLSMASEILMTLMMWSPPSFLTCPPTVSPKIPLSPQRCCQARLGSLGPRSQAWPGIPCTTPTPSLCPYLAGGAL